MAATLTNDTVYAIRVLLKDGVLSNPRIAAVVGTSERTVERHRRGLREGTGAASR